MKTFHIKFMSAIERRGPALPSECGIITGLHRYSLSLARQSGYNGDGAGVRLGGKSPVTSELMVWI